MADKPTQPAVEQRITLPGSAKAAPSPGAGLRGLVQTGFGRLEHRLGQMQDRLGPAAPASPGPPLRPLEAIRGGPTQPPGPARERLEQIRRPQPPAIPERITGVSKPPVQPASRESPSRLDRVLDRVQQAQPGSLRAPPIVTVADRRAYDHLKRPDASDAGRVAQVLETARMATTGQAAPHPQVQALAQAAFAGRHREVADLPPAAVQRVLHQAVGPNAEQRLSGAAAKLDAPYDNSQRLARARLEQRVQSLDRTASRPQPNPTGPVAARLSREAQVTPLDRFPRNTAVSREQSSYTPALSQPVASTAVSPASKSPDLEAMGKYNDQAHLGQATAAVEAALPSILRPEVSPRNKEQIAPAVSGGRSKIEAGSKPWHNPNRGMEDKLDQLLQELRKGRG